MRTVRIVRDYPHSPKKVWRVLTDPELILLWGMRPEGFSTEVGTEFRLYGVPNEKWRGFVECRMLEAVAPRLLRYSWIGNEGQESTEVSFRLEPRGTGTRVTFVHSGFVGVKGFVFATLFMAPGWKRMFRETFPAVLGDVNDDGILRTGSTLRPLFPKSA
ncbi:MAG TPA: SRPBCC domain-containing protein [Polyangiaceae bacterium]|nr:SRPBCC domain-containing protein [Polyangiaceae bacterium]